MKASTGQKPPRTAEQRERQRVSSAKHRAANRERINAERCAREAERRALRPPKPPRERPPRVCRMCGGEPRPKRTICRACDAAAAREWYERRGRELRGFTKAESRGRGTKPPKGTPERRAYGRDVNRRYRERHPERVVALRKAEKFRRKARTVGEFTADEWLARFQQYDGRCHWCGQKISGSPHADHLIPLSRGGTNTISNIVPSCATCNLSKNDKLPHEWNGRLL